MTKFLLQIFLTILVFGCTSKKNQDMSHLKTNGFEYFEMSYRGGWIGGFSFRADTNNIFFSPQKWDTVRYGILPDNIFHLIDTTLMILQNDTTIKSNYNYCDDCDLIALKAIKGQDTIEIFQVGEISMPFKRFINEIEPFLDNAKHQYFNAFMTLETARQVAPPLPPEIKEK